MKIAQYIAVISITLLLNGCVGLFIAGTATTVSIATDSRTTKEIINDNNIALEIAGINNKSPFVDKTRITANADHGIVVLMGQSENQQLSNDFENKVRAINGVKKIHNQIRIKPPLDLTTISHDTWITTKVKSSLIAESRLNGVKIKVITEDGEVFLMGTVSRYHANIAAEVTRNVSSVKQVIKAFQYLD